jgi:hypothetical protein
LKAATIEVWLPFFHWQCRSVIPQSCRREHFR